MGAFGSKNTVAPMLPASALSASQVSEAVKVLGAPYAPYAEKIQENGIDGAFLEAITGEDLPGLLADIGVTSGLHQKKLEIVFNSFKSGGSGTVDGPLDTMHAAFTPSSRISREMRLLYWRSRLGSFEVAEKEID